MSYADMDEPNDSPTLPYKNYTLPKTFKFARYFGGMENSTLS